MPSDIPTSGHAPINRGTSVGDSGSELRLALSGAVLGPDASILQSLTHRQSRHCPSWFTRFLLPRQPLSQVRAQQRATCATLSLRPVLATLFALVLLLLTGLVIASADQGIEQHETFVTRLEPGDNVVGWTTETVSVDSLFDEVHQAQRVWTWDSSWRRWRFAAPTLPRTMWTLHTLRPGMGLIIHLSGRDSFDWERPRPPAQGTVQLQPGWNLVTWLGRDSATLDQVTLGIGRSLRSVVFWNRGRGQPRLYDHTAIAPSDGLSTVRYGDPLWIDVTRSIQWLQPTGILPPIHYSGGASDSFKERFRTDLSEIISYYWENFGVEADFAKFRILVPNSPSDYFDMLTIDRPDAADQFDWERLPPGYFRPSAYRGDVVVVKQEYWTDNTTPLLTGRSLLMHEYTHAVEYHLAGNATASKIPDWLIEGFARFAEDLLQHADGMSSRKRTETDAWQDIRHAPPLVDSTTHNAARYRLGRAAMYLLTEHESKAAPIEYYRLAHPQGIGPGQQWESHTTWDSALGLTFGVSLGEFYSLFSARRPGTGTLENWNDSNHHHEPVGSSPAVIVGSVVFGNGEPGTPWKVAAYCQSLDAGFEVLVRRGLGDGTFEASIPDLATCILRVELGPSGCAGYYREGNLVSDSATAERLMTGPTKTIDVQLILDQHECPAEYSGRLLSESGEPLQGIAIRMHDRDPLPREFTGSYRPVQVVLTDRDGSFRFSAPAATSRAIELMLNPDGCLPIGRDDGSMHFGIPVGRGPQRTPVGVTFSTGRSNVEVRVPDHACSYGVQGIVVDSLGRPQSFAEVRIDGTEQFVPVLTETDGAFSALLSIGGHYQVTVDVGDAGRRDCSVLYRPAEFEQQSSGVWVGAGDDLWIVVRLPETCSKLVGRVSGDFEDTAGNLVINAHRNDGVFGAGAIEEDGSFAIAIPDPGAYRLSVQLPGCTVYYRNGGATSSREAASWVHLEQDEVRTEVTFDIPANACERGIRVSL